MGNHVVDYLGHQIDFVQVKVIDGEIRNKHMKVMEAIYIRKRKPILNRQGWYDLHAAVPSGGGNRHMQTTQYS